jgi:hypothetical protein
MRTPRDIDLQRAILTALAAVPADLLLGDETLRADAARLVHPRAAHAELDAGIAYLDGKRRIAGITGETGMIWQITDAGRLWLAQNP